MTRHRKHTHLTSSLLALPLAALLSLGAGCGDPEPEEPFTLLIRSNDIALSAVTRLEIEIDPEPLRFQPVEMMDYAEQGGTVTTLVSAVGEWTLNADATWVREHANLSPAMGVFEVEVPIWTMERIEDVDESISLPVTVRVYRGGQLISNNDSITGFLMYPAPPGNTVTLRVGCRTPDFEAACRNEDL
jgi:hypothetical protein